MTEVENSMSSTMFANQVEINSFIFELTKLKDENKNLEGKITQLENALST